LNAFTKASADQPAEVAQQVRIELGFDAGPVRTLREKLTSVGVRVFQLPVQTRDFSGLSSLNHAYEPRILLNAHEPTGRRNFTIAHETAHLLYGHNASICQVRDQWGTERRMSSV